VRQLSDANINALRLACNWWLGEGENHEDGGHEVAAVLIAGTTCRCPFGALNALFHGTEASAAPIFHDLDLNPGLEGAIEGFMDGFDIAYVKPDATTAEGDEYGQGFGVGTRFARWYKPLSSHPEYGAALEPGEFLSRVGECIGQQ
jgi:hypothetical protein